VLCILPSMLAGLFTRHRLQLLLSTGGPASQKAKLSFGRLPMMAPTVENKIRSRCHEVKPASESHLQKTNSSSARYSHCKVYCVRLLCELFTWYNKPSVV